MNTTGVKYFFNSFPKRFQESTTYVNTHRPVIENYSLTTYAPQILFHSVCVCVFIKLHITTQSGPVILVILCHSVCVCVCFLPFHSGHQVRWTYQPGSHRRKVTQEEGHTGFLIHLLSAVRALIFLARRIQPFLSLVDRKVEFCVRI